MFEHHQAIAINQFNGLFDVGEDEAIPADHFRQALNLRYGAGSFKTREGSLVSIAFGGVLRFRVYKITGQASRLLVLIPGGQLYDSTQMSAPILTVPGMIDFSMQVFFDRAYITPHNGVTGLPGESIYVYNGSGSARKAGGAGPPASPGTNPQTGAPGNGDAGIHLFAVGFETASGFITGMGAFSNLDIPEGYKTNITNIPIGPAGTVARVIFATKSVTDPAVEHTWSNDYNNQEWFFVPGGRIQDNSSTSTILEFFDADLVDQADYILEQLPTIPAGVGIGSYKGSMVVWGEDAHQSTVRFSKVGEPESFNEVEGFLEFDASDGGGVKNCVEFRSNFYAFKAQRAYATQDNGNEPLYWSIDQLDGSAGTEPHGVSIVFERASNTIDKYLIASRRGLLMFTGSFQENLTWKISDVWDRITPTYFYKTQVLVDADAQTIFVGCALDGATQINTVLYGDYGFAGLVPSGIKWSIWKFPEDPVSIALDINDATKQVVFKFAGTNIYKLDETATNDYGHAITTIFETGHQPFDSLGEVYHHGGVRLRAQGVGNLVLTLTTLDNSQVHNAVAIPLANGPGVYPFRLFNAQSEKATLKGSLTTIDQHLVVTKLYMFVRPLWITRPQ